jgi:hypothetical protein
VADEVIGLRNRKAITTRDPEAIYSEHRELCSEAKSAGWPDEYGPRLDELRVEYEKAMEERGYLDLRGFPLTPYVLQAGFEALRNAPPPKPLRTCCRYPECFDQIPTDATHCWHGHQQIRGVKTDEGT